MQETWVWFLGEEDPLEKEIATHSSTLAWKIPWMEKPGRLQPMGSQRAGHNWATPLSFTSDSKESVCNAGDRGSVPRLGRSPGKGNGYALQYSCLENSMARGTWWATVHGSQRVRHDWVTNTLLQCMGYKRTDVLLHASRGESFFLPFLECPYSPGLLLLS